MPPLGLQHSAHRVFDENAEEATLALCCGEFHTAAHWHLIPSSTALTSMHLFFYSSGRPLGLQHLAALAPNNFLLAASTVLVSDKTVPFWLVCRPAFVSTTVRAPCPCCAVGGISLSSSSKLRALVLHSLFFSMEMPNKSKWPAASFFLAQHPGSWMIWTVESDPSCSSASKLIHQLTLPACYQNRSHHCSALRPGPRGTTQR
jgi:hypothetical protein